MAWTDIPDANIEPDKSIRATDILAIRDNIAAQANGDPGAPQQQTAGIADLAVTTTKLATGAVTQAKVAASAIGQSQLKTTIGEVSTASTTPAILTLPGGAYGFYPQIRVGGVAATYNAGAVICHDTLSGNIGTAYATRISLFHAYESYSTLAQQRHIQASPPYDLGDGEIGQFVFAVVNNVSGQVESVYASTEAPWHHNGPTDIRAEYYDDNGRGWRWESVLETNWVADGGDYIPVTQTVGRRLVEITQAVKQRDMPIIPHPFLGNDLTDKTVVLLDPVADLTWTLAEMHEQGVSLNELLHDDYIRIGNDPLNRAGPPGVMVAQAKWKLT